MDLSNVKLVVSDMDGTLLNSKGEVSPLFFKLFKKLQEKNITFCAASGRQYHSIVEKLATIKDDIYVIAENGAIAKKADKILLQESLEPSKIEKIIPILRDLEDTNFVLCTKDAAFIESKDERFIGYFKEYYHNYNKVDDLLDVVKHTPVLKIAVYNFKSSEDYILPAIKHLENDYLLKVSGKNWLDISTDKANKGNALRQVQNLLNVSKKETMVFGDYHNDIEMLKEAAFSFSMENAHKDITEIANYATKSNDNFGVETILEKLVLANT